MNTPNSPWIDLTLQQAQRWHHLAWFLYGCLEREHVLNVDAFVAWWMRGVPSSTRSSAMAIRRCNAPHGATSNEPASPV
jgi:hypothetical protein